MCFAIIEDTFSVTGFRGWKTNSVHEIDTDTYLDLEHTHTPHQNIISKNNKMPGHQKTNTELEDKKQRTKDKRLMGLFISSQLQFRTRQKKKMKCTIYRFLLFSLIIF